MPPWCYNQNRIHHLRRDESLLLRKRILLLGIIILLFLSACGKEEDSSSKDHIAKVLNTFLLGEPKTLDPSMSTDTYSGDILINIFEGLTRIAPDSSGEDSIAGAGALSWEVNSDETVWTFHLRDYTWEDGKKVTAEDYVYGIRRSLAPATASPYSYLLFPIRNAEGFNRGDIPMEDLGVKALDEDTLEITLKNKTPYFLELTYSSLMLPEREDIVTKYGDRYGSSRDTIIANGPFRLKGWDHEQKITIEKNPAYWDRDSVGLDTISFYITRDENVRMNMLFKDEAQIGEASKKEWADKFISSGDFYEYPGYSAATNYLFFNEGNELFKNKNIRKAFSMGIKREEMSEMVYRGLFEPAYGWVAPGIHIDGVDFRKKVGDTLPHSSSTEAREYLLKGLQELGMGTTKPEDITVTYLNPSTSTWARTYSEYLAKMYKETLGINVRSEFLSWPVFEERIARRDYDFGGMAWYADYNDPSSFLEIFSGQSDVSPISWDSREYDALLKKAFYSEDAGHRLDNFAEAEKLLLDRGWVAPTVFIKRRIFISNNVKGYYLTPFTSPDYKNVSIEKNN